MEELDEFDEFALYVDLAMAKADDKQKVKLFSYLIGKSGGELLDTLMGDTSKDAWKKDTRTPVKI